MGATVEELLERVEEWAVEESLADFRAAREEFFELTGRFEDGEQWFDLRTAMFVDWFVLDRVGPAGLTPVERYLVQKYDGLTPDERTQLQHLTVTLRSVFEVVERRGDSLLLRDLPGGGEWLVASVLSNAGLAKGDMIGARLIYSHGRPTVGRGIVLHPHEAAPAIEEIAARARAEGMPPRHVVDHLDKMRLKLDRYSNVRIQHVYRYPGDARF